jgi:hypothetical protein
VRVIRDRLQKSGTVKIGEPLGTVFTAGEPHAAVIVFEKTIGSFRHVRRIDANKGSLLSKCRNRAKEEAEPAVAHKI